MRVCKGTNHDPVTLMCERTPGVLLRAEAVPTFWQQKVGDPRIGYIIQCVGCPEPKDTVCKNAVWLDHDWRKWGHATFVPVSEAPLEYIGHSRDPSVRGDLDIERTGDGSAASAGAACPGTGTPGAGTADS